MAKESQELKAALLGGKAAPASTAVARSSSSKQYKPLEAVGYQGPVKTYPKGSWFVQAGAYTKKNQPKT